MLDEFYQNGCATATESFSLIEAYEQMNCEWCQTRINDYVDGVLNEADSARLEKHLEICAPCAFLRDDLNAILHCCLEVHNAPDAPPNAQSLWLRISNLIES